MNKVTIEPITLLSQPTINLRVDVSIIDCSNNAFDGHNSAADFIYMPWLSGDVIQHSGLFQSCVEF